MHHASITKMTLDQNTLNGHRSTLTSENLTEILLYSFVHCCTSAIFHMTLTIATFLGYLHTSTFDIKTARECVNILVLLSHLNLTQKLSRLTETLLIQRHINTTSETLCIQNICRYWLNIPYI